MKLLIDSVILLDHFNGLAVATDYLRQVAPDAAVSVVTRTELLANFPPAGRAPALRLLDAFPTLTVDGAIADLAADLRYEHGIRLADALQAAIACRHGLKLVTRDRDAFPPSRWPFVVVPYELPAGGMAGGAA